MEAEKHKQQGEISLTQGKIAIVDIEDYENLISYNWHAKYRAGLWHAARWTKVTEGRPRRLVFMHCQIMGAKGIDHQDGNGLNNIRRNLRTCNQSQNGANRKPNTGHEFKGVHKRTNTFWAAIQHNSRSVYLGTFTTKEEAARAYDKAATRFFGNFARLNFPVRGAHVN